MTPTFLNRVLDSQAVRSDSKEMRNLRDARLEVEQIIQSSFADCNPTIRYGGSKIKGTMNLIDYDLDLICYFPRNETMAGETIAEIYYNVANVLKRFYNVDFKTSALKLIDADGEGLRIDVVPGRFIDNTKQDAFLHQHENPDKEILKTNLEKHITFVRESGCIDDIRLAKLWRPCVGIDVKTFLLELLVIKILKGSNFTNLEDRFVYFLDSVRSNIESVSIEDPANSNNKLNIAFSHSLKQSISNAATYTLRLVSNSGWQSVFGDMIDYSQDDRQAAFQTAIISERNATPPWVSDQN